MRKIFINLIITPAILFILLAPISVYAAAPAIFFSDTIDGPTSGWEGSKTQGAAVTIWGTNLGGTVRGTSTITVCGITLNQDSDFAEWGVVNVADGTGTDYSSARGLQRITFWLNSSMVKGAGTIRVATSGGTSNIIPFYCRALGSNKIYFVSTLGDDNNSGLTVATAWRNPYKAKATMKAGDVTYVKGVVPAALASAATYTDKETLLSAGTYTAYDPPATEFGNYNLYFNNDYLASTHANGTANNSITLASYPGEIAILGEGDPGLNANIVHHGSDTLSYWTFSKFKMRSAGNTTYWPQFTAGSDDHIRFVGNDVATTGPNAGTSFAFNGGNLGQTYLYLYGNHAHDAACLPRGSLGNAQVNTAYPLYFNGYGSHDYIYVGWNEFDHNSNGRGMQLYGHLVSDWMDHVYIHDNYIHDNYMTGAVLGGGDGGTGLNGEAGAQPYQFIRNLYFYNNILSNNGSGGYPCLLMGGENWGGIHGNWFIYNNICYHNYSGEMSVSSSSSPDLIVIKNNILYALRGQPYYSSKTGSFYTGSNNLYYGNESGVQPWETNSLDNINPQFVGALNLIGVTDFALQSTSPAIDAGTSSVIPIVTEDFMGLTRREGSSYDIGAFEYNTGSPLPEVPSTPTGVGVSSSD